MPSTSVIISHATARAKKKLTRKNKKITYHYIIRRGIDVINADLENGVELFADYNPEEWKDLKT
jgi:hypothetical protein